VLIQPQIPQGIIWAKTFKETPYGPLVVNWELKEKTIELHVEIPIGIEAGVFIPAGTKEYNMDGKEYNLSGEKSEIVGLKSGKYNIKYTL
jgi:alpha-L-rhamnosidase